MAKTPLFWIDFAEDLATARSQAATALAKSLNLDALPPDRREDREMAIGKHLQDAFCAGESALERLLQAVDGSLPQGRGYHQDLLDRAAREEPDLRPAVIGRQTLLGMRKLLGFRHVFRHQYEAFDYALAAPNVAVAAETLPRLAAEVEAFATQAGLKPPA